MAAKSISFFVFSMAILVTLSVVLTFWFYLLIIFAAAIVIMGAIEYYQYVRWGIFRASLQRRISPRSQPTVDGTTDRKMRNKIQKEWDRRSGFGSAEDLR